MGNGIANLLSGAADGYAATEPANMTEAQRMAWYKKMGKEPPKAKEAPLSRAVKWIGDKLGSTAAPTTSAVASAASSSADTTSLLGRLKAGNIDQPGSEANIRWGSGKAAMDEASDLALASKTKADSPTDADVREHFTTQEWIDAPDSGAAASARDADWRNLPGGELDINPGA